MSPSIRTSVATGAALMLFAFNGCERGEDSALKASADRIDLLVQRLYSFHYIETFPAPPNGLALYFDVSLDAQLGEERLNAIGINAQDLLGDIKVIADSIVLEVQDARAIIKGREKDCVTGDKMDDVAVANHILGNAKLLFNLVYEGRFPFLLDNTVHELESCDPYNPDDVQKVGDILNEIEFRANSISAAVDNCINPKAAVGL